MSDIREALKTTMQALRDTLPCFDDRTGSPEVRRVYERAEGAIIEARAALADGGWRDMKDAPKDEIFIGRREDDGSVVRVWWQQEFDAFISECHLMQMHNGFTFEDGSTHQLHSPSIEYLTGWIPYPGNPTPPTLPTPPELKS